MASSMGGFIDACLKTGEIFHVVLYIFEESDCIPWTGRALLAEVNRIRRNRGHKRVTKFDLNNYMRKDGRYRLARIGVDPDDNIWEMNSKYDSSYG